MVGCCLGHFTLDGVAVERMGAAEDGEPPLVVNPGDGLFLDTVPLASCALLVSSLWKLSPLRAAIDAGLEGDCIFLVLECGMTGL